MSLDYPNYNETDETPEFKWEPTEQDNQFGHIKVILAPGICGYVKQNPGWRNSYDWEIISYLTGTAKVICFRSAQGMSEETAKKQLLDYWIQGLTLPTPQAER
jgi:hypothetical protein